MCIDNRFWLGTGSAVNEASESLINLPFGSLIETLGACRPQCRMRLQVLLYFTLSAQSAVNKRPKDVTHVTRLCWPLNQLVSQSVFFLQLYLSGSVRSTQNTGFHHFFLQNKDLLSSLREHTLTAFSDEIKQRSSIFAIQHNLTVFSDLNLKILFKQQQPPLLLADNI